MTKAIPPHLLDKVLVSSHLRPAGNPSLDKSVQDLIQRGKVFTFGSSDIHVSSSPNALDKATEYAGQDGVVAGLPVLIAGKAAAELDDYLWSDWFTANSQEYFGRDRQGKLFKPDSPTLIIVHGAGILTPGRMRPSNEETNITHAEFNMLLEGRLSEGDEIEIYTIEEAKRGLITDPFGRYGVVLEISNFREFSGHYDKKGFMENPLVLARAGTMGFLEEFFDKAKDWSGCVGNIEVRNRESLDRPYVKELLMIKGTGGICGVAARGLERYVAVRPEGLK
jgi:hypothetical protein